MCIRDRLYILYLHKKSGQRIDRFSCMITPFPYLGISSRKSKGKININFSERNELHLSFSPASILRRRSNTSCLTGKLRDKRMSQNTSPILSTMSRGRGAYPIYCCCWYYSFSPAVSRNITGYFSFPYRRYIKLLSCRAPQHCGVLRSNIGEVARSDGGVKKYPQ